MAITTTARLGLKHWSDDLDEWSRADWAANVAAIEAGAAKLLSGTALPAATAANARTFFYDTDDDVLYYSQDGTTWRRVTPPASDFVQVEAGSLITTNAVQDVPSLSVVMACPGTTAIYEVHVDLNILTQNANAGILKSELWVDGVARYGTIEYRSHVASDQSAISRTWHVTGLAAGNRTFKTRGWTSGPLGYVIGLGSAMAVKRLR